MNINKNKRRKALEDGNFFAFIPNRLEIKDRPELTNFPLNVMFMGFAVRENSHISGTALYEPVISSFKEESELQAMLYKNIYGEESWLYIQHEPALTKWTGKKFVSKRRVGMAVGTEWNQFFIHLTMLGLTNGERCRFS